MKKIRHMSKKIDIGSVFLSDYNSSFSGREVARLSSVSPQTALTLLSTLVDEKILLVRKEGRNNKYSLNLDDLRCKLFLQAVEVAKSLSFLNCYELREMLDFVKSYSEAVIVFGSFAQGKEKEHSDLDLIVINGNKNKVKGVKKIFSREINMEFVTWKQFSDAFKKKKTLALEVEKNHLVYGNVFKVVEVYCS